MLTTVLSLIGLLAVAFVICCLNCPPMLSGTIRRLTARKIGLDAHHEAKGRFMAQTEAR